MQNARMVVRNKERLFKKLRALDGAMERELQVAAMKGAEEVAQMAANLAPKNPATPSDYAGTINAKPVDVLGRTEFNAAIGVGKIKKGEGSATNGVAAAGVFAKWVWRIIEGGSVNNPPQPHMLVAYRALRKRVQGRMSRAINKAAKRIAAQ